MEIDKAGFLPPLQPVALPQEPSAAAAGEGQSFSAWLGAQIAKVDGEIAGADRQLALLAAGRADNVHQVMIALEEVRHSFQLMMQVRNRLLEAYQEVLRMQV